MAAALLLAALTGVAFAHPAPNSIVRLEFRPTAVAAECWVPVSELDYARAADPGGDLPAYLLRHFAVQTASGVRWRVAVGSVRHATYLEHDYILAELTLVPPAGASVDEFVLVDDAVTHEVRNHVVYVVARHGADSNLVGALQYPARQLEVAVPERTDSRPR
jgi:hypothetical protein